MLTYSVRPRGGVVHALEVSEALARRGHEVELVALAKPGERLFRDASVPVHTIAHTPTEDEFDARIQGMLHAYRDGLRELLGARAPDVLHAQDCLSCNAAVALRDEGVTPHVIRTVHHVDDFRSPSLIACQDRSILAPDRLLCVSLPWVRRLREDYGVDAGVVSNGVDLLRHRPPEGGERERDRERLGFGGRHVILTVGGVEPRKGSLTLLEAFARVRESVPHLRPLLVVAGGATLFDYRDEIDRFAARRRELGLGDDAVRVTGSLPDAEMEALFRSADVFAFPSVREGFGLAALEALACGLPVVASDLDVFTDFLIHERSALVVPVGDADGLGAALTRLASNPAQAARLADEGRRIAESLTWDASAEQHERAYASLLGSRAGLAASA